MAIVGVASGGVPDIDKNVILGGDFGSVGGHVGDYVRMESKLWVSFGWLEMVRGRGRLRGLIMRFTRRELRFGRGLRVRV